MSPDALLRRDLLFLSYYVFATNMRYILSSLQTFPADKKVMDCNAKFF